MPNKTIYVTEEDLPLFERAQELAGGNLSAAIARGVRRFVEVEEGIMEGQREITVTVGEAGLQRAKRFVGTRIVKWETPFTWEVPAEARVAEGEPPRESLEVFSVYRTAGGRLAVHSRRPASRRGAFYSERWSRNPEDPEGFWREDTEATLEVYDDIDQLAAHIPSELAARVWHALSHPDVEVLDI